ncbi:MAG: L-2-amino-thiazoline-4-carboxylic acid hydrolase [Deltaproteobacteria bacterium]|nr:L-2-amino-thiazoline-4-carboxylic acid hydrolase [Deltaproteobacteria bacterium]
MAELPVEKKFPVLCEIARAQHFAWHEAVRQMCPGVDLAPVVNRMWEISGHDTARAYLKRLDKNKPLAPQVASSIVWSSQCMGEDAKVEETPGKDEAFVRHGDCPWFHWHKRLGLLAEDRPGCDVWFKTIVDDINQAFGTRLRVATTESLPDGGKCCLRRFWVD